VIPFSSSILVSPTPDSALLTGVKGGTHWVLIDTAVAKSSGTLAEGDTLFTIDCLADMSGEPGAIAAAGDVVISCTATFSGLPPGMSSDCEWNGDLTATGEGLPINITIDNCPRSGVINYSGTMVMDCPSPVPSYSNTWSAGETYSNGSVTWHIENETKYWDTQGYCIWYLDY